MDTGPGFKRPTRLPHRVVYALLFTLIVVIIVLLLPRGNIPTDKTMNSGIWRGNEEQQFEYFTYNFTYPLTPPTSELHVYNNTVCVCVCVCVCVYNSGSIITNEA